METNPQQRILVFQQHGSGERKIQGLREYGGNRFDIRIISIDETLPPVLDDATGYLPRQVDADIVLDYLKHPDLSEDLSAMCHEKNIPVVASGKKLRVSGVFTPPTCCGLPPDKRLGEYGKRFGAPEFILKLDDGAISDILVLRGAPCGATWKATARIQGLGVEEALVRVGLGTQFFCCADPSGWDPICGKSPVHFAGKIHMKALKRAVDRWRQLLKRSSPGF
jgi:hypothetical protein